MQMLVNLVMALVAGAAAGVGIFAAQPQLGHSQTTAWVLAICAVTGSVSGVVIAGRGNRD